MNSKKKKKKNEKQVFCVKISYKFISGFFVMYV